ncbi:aspartate kinase [Clostridium weizhouense]|uniref:Aspartokinase n=1 Tax=Clostridium weizhouense TaxID=2859781 RepID=A0ABS7ALZ2_9CLOT|nr:aspartate kinase [Clostridium weizhouense]MBW6409662.1 aspartate kinase [Clostridium weizhouense]
MGVIVQKYGGSSVGDVNKIKQVAKTLVKRKESGDSLVVVVSAMGDTTDNLIELAKQISKEPDRRELDALIATGEMISSSLLAMAIKELGYDAVSYTAYQVGIRALGPHGKSLIENINGEKIRESLLEGKIVVVAGFQGINEDGDITTLGRGGSDTSAVAIAVRLDGECEIYTDVDGIYTVDPRKYSNAKKLDEIDYEDMLELSSLGSQVMHSRSIELAEKYKIPVYVGLSNSDIKGTVIREVKNMNLESKPITGIATSEEDIIITLKEVKNDINIIANLFEKIASKRINVDMISQTSPIEENVNLSFSIPKDDLRECMNIISEFTEKDKVFIDEDITKFSIVGIGMKTTSGVAGRLFKLFAENNISIKMITTSEIRITCAIKKDDKVKAINATAKEFDL